MAGTPWRAVQSSSDKAAKTAGPENVGLGKIILAPCVKHARRPNTSPKQWKRGGGQQRISDEVNDMRLPMDRALLIRLLNVCQTLTPLDSMVVNSVKVESALTGG